MYNKYLLDGGCQREREKARNEQATKEGMGVAAAAVVVVVVVVVS